MPVLVYGLKDGKLLHISKAENGIECGCVCPNCGEKLVAKQGDINSHHFAHVSKECDITYAQETALHYMAKDIFAEMKYVWLPGIIMESNTAFYDEDTYEEMDIHYSYYDFLVCGLSKYKKSKYTIDGVEIEKYLGDIKPDIVLDIGGKKLLVEIAVTHFIDKKKKEKIINKDIPTIKIDLSAYKKDVNSIDRDKLKNILINKTNNKEWIYYERYNDDIKHINEYNNYILKRLSDAEGKRNKGSREYNLQYKCVNIDYDGRRLDFWNFWERSRLSRHFCIPWFIDFPIDGDILINGDRKIWQLLIVDRLYHSPFPISKNNIVKYVLGIKKLQPFKYKNLVLCDYDAKNRASFITTGDRRLFMKDETRTFEDVITDYYTFLQDEKIIDSKGAWIYKMENGLL